MKKIGIFYGSTLGSVRNVATKIHACFGADHADILNIENASATDLKKYDNLIFGTSTWGLGEMQEDWENFAVQLEKVDFSKKKIALFGVGNQVEWTDSFVNGMGMLHHRLGKNARIVGLTSLEGYNFEISLAVKDNQFVGLAIDDINQPELTDSRIEKWVQQLKTEFAE